MEEVKIKSPEVIFIEWMPSKLIWYVNPITFEIRPQCYWATIPNTVMEYMDRTGSSPVFFYEEYVKSFGDDNSFTKSAKLLFLTLLKKQKQKIVFASRETISLLRDTFSNDLPRVIRHVTHPLNAQYVSNYYIYFDNYSDPATGTVDFIFQSVC
jgi:hypothetical protein